MGTVSAWESKKSSRYYTCHWSVAFVLDGTNYRGHRKLSFMLWAGRSHVLKDSWCHEEETEMRKIKLRLTNGNLGTKWQNRAIVKGVVANAARVPTALSPPILKQPPKTLTSHATEWEIRKLQVAFGFCPWSKEVSLEQLRKSSNIEAMLPNENILSKCKNGSKFVANLKFDTPAFLSNLCWIFILWTCLLVLEQHFVTSLMTNRISYIIAKA